MESELLQKVRVLDPLSGTDRLTDVLINDGFIEIIHPHITECFTDTLVRDCEGMILGPGLVDLYSHSGEPGWEERETFQSLIDSANAGGFTRIAILPDTKPPLDHAEIIRGLRTKIPVKKTKLYCWGALTLGGEGQQMTELSELSQTEIVGFTDGLSLSNLLLVRRLLEYLKPLNKPIALWPMDRHLKGNGVIREGAYSIRLGLPGNPAFSETSSLAALLEIIAEIGTPVHIMRLSTARSVELIKRGKEQGLPITASTSWIHLLLDTKALTTYDPNLRLEPPLGNPEDRLALIQGVKTGVIDVIAIDHQGYTYEEKTVAFTDAPPGTIGLELVLPLLWHELVEEESLKPLELWRALSTNPALCLGQTPPQLKVGSPVELTLFSPQQNWMIERKNLRSLSLNTPWLGHQLQGRVIRTLISSLSE